MDQTRKALRRKHFLTWSNYNTFIHIKEMPRIKAVCATHIGPYPKPVMAALEEQAAALLFARYRDTGRARVFVLTDAALTEALGAPLALPPPNRTPYLTAKGAVLDAPLIQAHRTIFPNR